MPTMRAKLRLDTVTKHEGCESLKFHAVSRSGGYPEDGGDENNTYAKWSPTADLNMTITNPALFGQFEPGQEFYVDFIKAEAPAAA